MCFSLMIVKEGENKAWVLTRFEIRVLHPIPCAIVWHTVPDVPVKQLHLYELAPVTTQEPPFWQGLGEHTGSGSGK